MQDIKEGDFKLNISQKGVDMRIDIDIAHLSFCKQVDKIILISGDSDFVAASKQARREGIDFVKEGLTQLLNLIVKNFRLCYNSKYL